MIVTEKANRGEEFGDLASGATAMDTTVKNGASSGTTSGTFRAFKDSWGTPIIFVRFATNVEINAPPFTKGATSNDPLDPKGRLYNSGSAWPNPTPKPSDSTWPTANQAGAFASSIYLGKNTGLTAFPNANWLLAAVSAGSNKDDPNHYDSVDLSATPATGLYTVATDTDDILGYRLLREGNRGD